MALVKELLGRVAVLDPQFAFARAHTMAAVMRLAGGMGSATEAAAAVGHAERILSTWRQLRRPATATGAEGRYRYDYDYQQVQRSTSTAAVKPERQLQQVLQMHHKRTSGAQRKGGAERKEL
jgi:hypothetical protein